MTTKTKRPPVPTQLITRIREQSEAPVGEMIPLLVAKFESLFKGALTGVIVYGSCLRNLDFKEGVVDLYVIVDSYPNAYHKRRYSLMNSILPPNVFYLELISNGITIHAKYAVITMDDLKDGIENWFHSYLWARFAQPVSVIYTDNDDTKMYLYRLFAESVIAYLNKTMPALGDGQYNSEQIWVNALSLSYAAELRPERHNRAQLITQQSIAELDALTQAAAPALAGILEPHISGDFHVQSNVKKQRNCLMLWRLRRWQGRILSLLRLVKAVFTFKDAVNYAAWKIERHTGITIEVTPVLQRHPILFGFTILWRLLRRDVLH
jgi:hypothetical protein